MKCYYGKVLRIDLTSRKVSIEEIPEEIFQKYLGGRGLGTHLMLNNIQPGIDPLSVDNKLIFVTGFAAGTKMYGSSRYSIFAKSPLTGLFGEASSGGKVGPALHATGYDAIILEGGVDSPIYLEISDQGVLFHDAAHLWGKDTYETEDALLAEVNKDNAQAVVIGPAGENLVRFACVENNYWRSAGRTGMGAVLGSKKVKGIVFHGTSKTEAVHQNQLTEIMKEIAGKAKGDAGVKGFQRLGTIQLVKLMNKIKGFPSRYWNDTYIENWQDISGDTLLKDYDVEKKACPKCFLACAKRTTVKEGPHQGITIEGPEYETVYTFGGLCQIDKLDEIIYLNDLCDRLGMDTISAGNIAALVMEAGTRGSVPLVLKYGDVQGTARLLEDIAYVRGQGKLLAQGIKTIAKEWGLEELAVHVKGLEPPGYDPRYMKGMALGYATSPRGACHLRATFFKPELSGMIDRKTTEGKTEMYIDWENRSNIFNTGVFCQFYRDLYEWPILERIIKAITGFDYSREELSKIANQIISEARIFNAREGASKSDDTLPPRMFKEKINNGEDGITAEELNHMVDEYYRLRGWTDSGYPMGR